MSAKSVAKAIGAIDAHGILLVYPMANRAEPRSLWSVLHPRATMRWAWDESGDARVVELWRLRERLARGREVVFTKWFRGRATFFARDVFRAFLADLRTRGPLEAGLSREARTLLDVLEEDSPQSTKQLRRAADLQGKFLESTYTKAMRELWLRGLVVGAGEVDDGAFPSLAIGATRLLFEDLWLDSADSSHAERAADAERFARALAGAPSFAREITRSRDVVAQPLRGSPPRSAE
jgi:hypothetical protein